MCMIYVDAGRLCCGALSSVGELRMQLIMLTAEPVGREDLLSLYSKLQKQPGHIHRATD